MLNIKGPVTKSTVDVKGIDIPQGTIFTGEIGNRLGVFMRSYAGIVDLRDGESYTFNLDGLSGYDNTCSPVVKGYAECTADIVITGLVPRFAAGVKVRLLPEYDNPTIYVVISETTASARHPQYKSIIDYSFAGRTDRVWLQVIESPDGLDQVGSYGYDFPENLEVVK